MVFARDTAQLIGESTHLVWVQLKEQDFAKRFRLTQNIWTLIQKWWRFLIITMQESVSEGCALWKNIRMTFQYFGVFLYETFSFIFGLGLEQSKIHNSRQYQMFILCKIALTWKYRNVILIFFAKCTYLHK